MENLVEFVEKCDKIINSKEISQENRRTFEYLRAHATLSIALAIRAPANEVKQYYKNAATKWTKANREVYDTLKIKNRTKTKK